MYKNLSNYCRHLYTQSVSGGFLGLKPNCETPLVHVDVDDLCRDETKASYSFFSLGNASRCRSGQLVGRSPVAQLRVHVRLEVQIPDNLHATSWSIVTCMVLIQPQGITLASPQLLKQFHKKHREKDETRKTIDVRDAKK